jgi:hypothetical protein
MLRLSTVITLALNLVAVPALAQTIGENSVFIGQTGDTNTIGIQQDGNTNMVGGPAGGLPLSQNGRFNTIYIEQAGSNNAVATDARDSARPSLGLVVTGTGQTGNRNEIEILQQTPLNSIAATVLEAVQQQANAAFAAASVASNRLELHQQALGATSGTQSVGQVIQKNTAVLVSDDVTNRVLIDQTGSANGSGNAVVTVYQDGLANQAELLQAQSGQRIETVQQVGSKNGIVLDQGVGIDNTVLAVEQMGMLNQLRLLQSGSRNVVGKVLQNNAGLAISGNKVTLTWAGNGNGGDGFGGLGTFNVVPYSWNVFQGLVSQIGDDNSVSYTTSAESARNLYGFVQEGDGNSVIATASGSGNEIAIRQIGDDNDVDVEQRGTANAAAVDMAGERNRLNLRQMGENNQLLLSVSGNSNNALNAARLTGDRLLSGMKPGEISQIGAFNTIDLTLNGDLNAFALSQEDDENRIEGFMTGSGNEAVVSQTGRGNVASFSQRGKGNGVSIRQ